MISHFQKQALSDLASLNALKSKLEEKVTEKKIHELRVLIKKLKAYHGLFDLKISFKKHYQAISALNQKAQKLRDAQILLKALKTLPAWQQDNGLERKLNKIIASKYEQIGSLLKKHHFNTLWVSNTDEFTRCIMLASAVEIKKSIAEIHAHPSAELPDDWHEIRKHLKAEWFEAQALYGDKIPLFLTKKLFPVKGLPHQLGAWHDWYIVCQYIEENKSHLKKADYFLLRQQAAEKLKSLTKDIKPAINLFKRL